MNGISRLPGTLPPDLSTPASLGRASSGKSAKAAREFEAHLIGPLLESLEKTFSAVPGAGDIAGADNYNYLGTEALAGALVDRGGFGIAALITRYLNAHEGNR